MTFRPIRSRSDQAIALAGFVYLDLHFHRPEALPEDGKEVFSDDFELYLGGIFNTAQTLNGLGHSPALFLPKGRGFLSEAVMTHLQERGFQTHAFMSQKPDPAVSVVFNGKEDRSFLSYADWDAFSSPLQPKPPKDFSWLHIGGLREARALETFIREIKKSANCQISVSGSWAPQELAALRKASRQTHPWDMLILNEAEAIEAFSTTEEALHVLSQQFDEVIITLGRRGAIGKAGKVQKQVVLPQEDQKRIRNTTGAGDAFCAGILSARTEGADLESQLKKGISAASRFLKGEFQNECSK